MRVLPAMSWLNSWKGDGRFMRLYSRQLWVVVGILLWQGLAFVMLLLPLTTYIRHGDDMYSATLNSTESSLSMSSYDETIHSRNRATRHMRAAGNRRIRRTLENNIDDIGTDLIPMKNASISGTSVNQHQTTTFEFSSSCPNIIRDVSVSLLTQSSIGRLRTLDLTCQRWKSPIIAVIVVSDPLDTSDSSLLQEYLTKWNNTCQQMQAIVYHLDNETEGTSATYPINTLRNIALEAASTSHILMIDVDFIPSNRLDQMIKLSIYKQQRFSRFGDMSREAMVIPAFDRRVKEQCATHSECAQLLQNSSAFIPATFQELHRCYFKDKNCIVFDGEYNVFGHSSTRTNMWFQKKWYTVLNDNQTEIKYASATEGNKGMFRTIPCFDSIAYEPYVVLQWCPVSPSLAKTKSLSSRKKVGSKSTVSPVAPYYDERFLGYGHNKIQYLAHIRWMGYRFAVLPKGGFLVHSPHTMSSPKATWLNGTTNALRTGNTNLFDSFLSELDTMYGTTLSKKESGARTFPRECVKPDVSATQSSRALTPVHMNSTSNVRIRRTIQNNIHSKSSNISGQATAFVPSSSCPRNMEMRNISVSLLTQSSISRLRTLDVTCQRWKSPIIVVVVVSDPIDAGNAKLLQDYLAKWADTCRQIQVIIYHLDNATEGKPEAYPINALRNIALEAVSTSHILMIDVDFIPSQGLDHMIKSSIKEQQKRSASKMNSKSTYGPDPQAIVIPAFDRRVKSLCATHEACADLLRNNSKFIPSNFDELHHCYYKAKDCIVFDGDINDIGHSSTRTDLWLQKKWYVSNERNSANSTNINDQLDVHATKPEAQKKMMRTLSCFDSIAYEPYVVLRWCPVSSSATAFRTVTPVAPYYDERFLGYGHNKIQFLAHIRWMGYQFAVIPNSGFLVHSPHVMSSQKATWLNGTTNALRTGNTELFETFLDELESIYDTTATTGKNKTGDRKYPRECVKQ